MGRPSSQADRPPRGGAHDPVLALRLVVPVVSIVARGDHGGDMAPSAEDVEQRGSQTRDELLARIRVCLGGRAAELLVYGPRPGLPRARPADLEHATDIARQMVCRYGMDDDFGLLVTPELIKYEEALSSPVYLHVTKSPARFSRPRWN